MKHARVRLAAVACLLSLGACAMLTAEAPLIAASDTRFALEPGLWAAKPPNCEDDPIVASPGSNTCLSWMRVEAAPDGWTLDFLSDKERALVKLAPASAANDEGFASLYIGEIVSLGAAPGDERAQPSYLAVTPEGPAPFRRLVAVPISCADALSDGPIEGIAVTSQHDRVTACVARSREALRAATRAATIASLPTRGEAQMEFVRP
jgi:hypothetical protein